MSRILLTSTDVAKRAGLSVHAFYANVNLYNPNDYTNSILNHRARPSRKKEGVMKPYWYLNNIYFGVNQKNHHGENSVN